MLPVCGLSAEKWKMNFCANEKNKRKHCSPCLETEHSSHRLLSCTDPEAEYMSDKMLAVNSIVEPQFRPIKRQVRNKTKPLNEIMCDALQDGISKPLDQGNLGFQMVIKLFDIKYSHFLLNFSTLHSAAIKNGISIRQWSW